MTHNKKYIFMATQYARLHKYISVTLKQMFHKTLSAFNTHQALWCFPFHLTILLFYFIKKHAGNNLLN